jgi:hypothetical protein
MVQGGLNEYQSPPHRRGISVFCFQHLSLPARVRHGVMNKKMITEEKSTAQKNIQIIRNTCMHLFDMSLLGFSFLLLLWSVLSFLGGPDAQFGSPESFFFGSMGLFLGIITLIASLRLMRETRRKIMNKQNENLS